MVVACPAASKGAPLGPIADGYGGWGVDALGGWNPIGDCSSRWVTFPWARGDASITATVHGLFPFPRFSKLVGPEIVDIFLLHFAISDQREENFQHCRHKTTSINHHVHFM